jgi:hypothetical protein
MRSIRASLIAGSVLGMVAVFTLGHRYLRRARRWCDSG